MEGLLITQEKEASPNIILDMAAIWSGRSVQDISDAVTKKVIFPLIILPKRRVAKR